MINTKMQNNETCFLIKTKRIEAKSILKLLANKRRRKIKTVWSFFFLFLEKLILRVEEFFNQSVHFLLRSK